MSGILFLGNDDFVVRAGENGNMLCLNGWKGLTLIVFYSKECQFCHKTLSIFKQLPQIVNGCKFGMVCVNRNMEVVEKSKNTIAPIEYVPDIILFVDGIPYIRYDSPHEIEDIKTFIFSVYEKLQKTCFSEDANKNAQSRSPPAMSHEALQQQQRGGGAARPPVTNPIPEYTVGIPVSGSRHVTERCYLDFKTAYPNRQDGSSPNYGIPV
jgi:hypothetical protein